KLSVPNAERLFWVGQAFAKGWDLERVFGLTKIDPWFLRQIEEIVQAQASLSNDRQAKRLGFSDRQIAVATQSSEAEVRRQRLEQECRPTYRLVDTCAAEFEAFTPYYYSTYGIEDEVRDSDKKKVIILGGGPNRIGQGIEFDYCCVHASFALRELGIESIMVNSNPETVSTDYDTSDKLYFEPLTLEDVLNIYERENRDDQVLGVIVQFGGQTPPNLAKGLEENAA